MIVEAATTPLADVGTTITQVLEWISSIINSLLTADGALSALWPFVLVGFTVSILMLAIKVIKSFSWGI